MANEFEPFDKQLKVSEFSAWEYKANNESAPAEEEHAELITELEALKQNAYQEGYTNGMQQAQKEIDDMKSELVKWLDLLQKPVHIIDEQLTQEIITTVIWLCQKSIAVELSISPDKLHSLFEKIKKELPSLHGKRILKMHPEDVDWIKANFSHNEIEGLLEILDGDPLLSRGDFYLQGDHSELDGRIETRLSMLFDQFITTEHLQVQPNSGKENNE
ncbi:FliH/SctL family protein [Legionella waltersii]|uniref:Flagellar assembly protein FliH n=1 Tax=Legionella waltersii TaxID=66969 RepID=A0A0W1AAP3_9GAMM|nr:FliH/SctL family protein [Legionella waltersii]KTD78415.1 polar flagellar assembly protein FliH [Legionella waltersii]SNV06166.1 flagellar assembly protein FliH [Legionella waltersii]